MVCMKDTGIDDRLMFPRTMFTQNTKAMGTTRDHWSIGFTSTSGRTCGNYRVRAFAGQFG